MRTDDGLSPNQQAALENVVEENRVKIRQCYEHLMATRGQAYTQRVNALVALLSSEAGFQALLASTTTPPEAVHYLHNHFNKALSMTITIFVGEDEQAAKELIVEARKIYELCIARLPLDERDQDPVGPSPYQA